MILILILVICVLGYLWWRSQNKKDPIQEVVEGMSGSNGLRNLITKIRTDSTFADKLIHLMDSTTVHGDGHIEVGQLFKVDNLWVKGRSDLMGDTKTHKTMVFGELDVLPYDGSAHPSAFKVLASGATVNNITVNNDLNMP